ITKNQLIIWLNNEQSSSAMDNMFGALNIINKKSASAKKAKGNGAIIYAKLLQKNDKQHAFTKLIEMADDTTNFIVDENALNDLAYEFYEFVNENLAFETLRSAIFLFPNNDNLYNSYGELLAKSGKKEEAIIMYKKSLKLNPENEDSINSLNKLQKE
ncbi:MAG: hypothetical protein WBP43_04330, partial [Chitinophagales bacterium]